jgi:LmbE family N-acetylglucosaminyl deacetylase
VKLPAIQNKTRTILFLVSMISILVLLFVPERYRIALPSLQQIPAIDITSVKTAVIFAPHNDDESLGTAGLIQALKEQGADVKVVLATNGDGTRFATMEDFHKVFPTSADYIRMGNLRQQETISAMHVLGLKDSDVIFLSYPDRGSDLLWNTYWDCTNPYRSLYSGVNQSIYSFTFNPLSKYCGEDYLRDVTSVLQLFKPDLVVFSDPDDEHPDHWGLSSFVRLAIRTMQISSPVYKPKQYTYLVHRPDYPNPMGYHPTQALLPPLALYQIDQDWYRLDLTDTMEQTKNTAIHQYKTQFPSLKSLLEAFIRKNELFSSVSDVALPVGSAGNWMDPITWQTGAGQPVAPILLDPVGDFVTRRFVGSVDITALYAIQTSDAPFIVCGELRSETEGVNSYNIRIKTYQSGTLHDLVFSTTANNSAQRAVRNGKFVCAKPSSTEIGSPQFMMVNFEVHAPRIWMIDHTAWVLLDMP